MLSNQDLCAKSTYISLKTSSVVGLWPSYAFPLTGCLLKGVDGSDPDYLEMKGTVGNVSNE